MRVFITGTAGFIGYHLAGLLLAEGHVVHGYDGITDYYDVSLKQRRYTMLRQHVTFTATEALLEDEGNHSVSGSNQISSEPRCFRAAL
jgi:UDP-glucuronate 4-epimerase